MIHGSTLIRIVLPRRLAGYKKVKSYNIKEGEYK